MNIKLFGLLWDIKPLLRAARLCILLSLVCAFFYFAFEENVVGVILTSLCMFFCGYILNTIESNSNETNQSTTNNT
jgi:hypothetical protein